MSTLQKDQVCSGVVEKMASGQSLGVEEKAHLIECESCMAELVRRLDHAAEESPAALGKNGDSGQDNVAHSRPEAKRAVEHGREVFAREFGLS